MVLVYVFPCLTCIEFGGMDRNSFSGVLVSCGAREESPLRADVKGKSVESLSMLSRSCRNAALEPGSSSLGAACSAPAAEICGGT